MQSGTLKSMQMCMFRIWCYGHSHQIHATGVRGLYKVISHSNMLKAALACARRKCGSGQCPKHFFQPDDFLWNSQKSKTCSRHAREAYSGVHWKRHSLKFIVWWCSQAYFVKVSTALLPDNELWIWSYSRCARMCLWWAFYEFFCIFKKSEYVTFSNYQSDTRVFRCQKSIVFIVSVYGNRIATACFFLQLSTNAMQN